MHRRVRRGGGQGLPAFVVPIGQCLGNPRFDIGFVVEGFDQPLGNPTEIDGCRAGGRTRRVACRCAVMAGEPHQTVKGVPQRVQP